MEGCGTVARLDGDGWARWRTSTAWKKRRNVSGEVRRSNGTDGGRGASGSEKAAAKGVVADGDEKAALWKGAAENGRRWRARHGGQMSR